MTGPLLVRKGTERLLTEREGGHRRMRVYTEMFLSILEQYPGLGDWRKLSFSEIEFFYDGMRHHLKKVARPNG
jgi:hypothetical protein